MKCISRQCPDGSSALERMSPLLFALVDALWLYRRRQWRYWRRTRRQFRMARDLVQHARRGMRKAGSDLGWWRSLWGAL